MRCVNVNADEVCEQQANLEPKRSQQNKRQQHQAEIRMVSAVGCADHEYPFVGVRFCVHVALGGCAPPGGRQGIKERAQQIEQRAKERETESPHQRTSLLLASLPLPSSLFLCVFSFLVLFLVSISMSVSSSATLRAAGGSCSQAGHVDVPGSSRDSTRHTFGAIPCTPDSPPQMSHHLSSSTPHSLDSGRLSPIHMPSPAHLSPPSPFARSPARNQHFNPAGHSNSPMLCSPSVNPYVGTAVHANTPIFDFFQTQQHNAVADPTTRRNHEPTRSVNVPQAQIAPSKIPLKSTLSSASAGSAAAATIPTSSVALSSAPHCAEVVESSQVLPARVIKTTADTYSCSGTSDFVVEMQPSTREHMWQVYHQQFRMTRQQGKSTVSTPGQRTGDRHMGMRNTEKEKKKN